MGSSSSQFACENFIREFEKELMASAPKVKGVYVDFSDLNLTVHYYLKVMDEDGQELITMFPEVIYDGNFGTEARYLANLFNLSIEEIKERCYKADC